MTTETHLVTELGMLKVRAQGPAIAGVWLATGDSQFAMAGWKLRGGSLGLVVACDFASVAEQRKRLVNRGRNGAGII
jgi:hypothetical protein